MPAFPLSAAWLKIASAGQAVEVQNLSAAPVAITIAPVAPVTTDGLVLAALDTRAFALVADLYARAAGAVPATIEVLGGFSLSGDGVTGALPFAAALPVVTGTAQAGQTLVSSQGVWTGAPTAYAYQWRRNGVGIAGATASTYLVVPADAGAALSVTVTATNAAGSATATGNVVTPVSGVVPGGGAGNTADFADPANAYLAALAA